MASRARSGGAAAPPQASFASSAAPAASRRRTRAATGAAAVDFFARAAPTDVLALVFELLPLKDAVAASSCSARVFDALLRGGREQGMWRRVARAQMARFIPAAAFFDGPTNESAEVIQGERPRAFFDAENADEHLAEVLAAMGPEGAVTWAWTHVPAVCKMHPHGSDMWERSRVQVPDAVGIISALRFERVAPPPAGAPGKATLRGRALGVKDGGGGGTAASPTPAAFDLRSWAGAWACASCDRPGSASRQCAACGGLLCLSCAVRCCIDGETSTSARSQPRTAMCAFALCPTCHEEESIVSESPARQDVLDHFGSGPPLLSRQICDICFAKDARLYCPAHLNCCILDCAECAFKRCPDHCCDGPKMAALCCLTCFHTLCSDCDKLERTCPACGTERTDSYYEIVMEEIGSGSGSGDSDGS